MFPHERQILKFGQLKFPFHFQGHENNFNKADKGTTTGFGVPYDFRSVMHYSNTAFSIDGRPTIIPKVSTNYRVEAG